MAKTVNANYDGNGRFSALGPHDLEALETTYETGQAVKLKITSPRSQKQSGFFFAWLHELILNLPEHLPNDCPSEFLDTEHLRAWMLCRTGHCHCWEFPREAIDIHWIEMLKQISTKHLFFKYTDTMVYVHQAKSMNMKTGMDQEQFNEFFDGAKALAQELIPGLDLDALKKRAEETQP